MGVMAATIILHTISDINEQHAMKIYKQEDSLEVGNIGMFRIPINPDIK